MRSTDPRSSALLVSAAGAVVAESGLTAAVALLGDGGWPLLLPLSEAGLALGTGVLAFGSGGVAGRSRVARAALLLFGAGPLLYRLVPAGQPSTAPVGMALIDAVTCATVATAVLIARAGRVHGVARWALLLVAADSIVTGAMSSVPAEGLAVLHLGAHLELLRPVALTAWGLALLLQAPAVRRRADAWSADWRRTTDVGGPVEP